MSSILDKLKIKPVPKTKEPIEISLKRREINIVDKTQTSNFDRELFLAALMEPLSLGQTVTEPATPEPATPGPATSGPATPKTLIPKRAKLVSAASVGPTPLGPASAEAVVATQIIDKNIRDCPPRCPTGYNCDKKTNKCKPNVKLVAAPGASVTAPVTAPVTASAERLTKAPPKTSAAGPSAASVAQPSVASVAQPSAASASIKASSYYMNNREIFINFMSSLFAKYKKELAAEAVLPPTCERSEEFSLMTHQKIVRDYLSLYTPYRGLLLYHGLGSGKTCSSIAIAEGLKSTKKIIIMTPASLKTNYLEELKKCGDSLYRKTQYWEFISTSENQEIIDSLSSVLSISTDYIKRAKGAWLINTTKESNFDQLTTLEKESLNKQLNEMINYKYNFISYNGLRNSHLAVLTQDFKINPFDNAVIIIDEAHNFVSRIVNKIGKKKDSLFMKLYEYLMKAQNARIVLLTGTPMINYPNELGILFNILRGKIKTWHFKLVISQDKKVSKEYLQKLLNGAGNLMDYLDYNPTSTTLTITRNPFGFVNQTQAERAQSQQQAEQYEGVHLGEQGNFDDPRFIKQLTNMLHDNGITIAPRGIKAEEYKALPDTLDDFKGYFINQKNDVQNMDMFKRRIMGLTSYFRSAQEGLMPQYEKSRDFIIVRIEMSPFQFTVYEEARAAEREVELKNAKKKKKQSAKKPGANEDIYDEVSSTYRIFSRLFCNFVFPEPAIHRPMPNGDKLQNAILNETTDEDIVDATSAEDKIANGDGKYEADEAYAQEAAEEQAQAEEQSSEAGDPKLSKKEKKIMYEKSLLDALKKLEDQGDLYLKPEALQTYSPKFLNILENIKDPAHLGLHLVYSQFRTLEGIGILKLVLEANGFAQFKIVKDGLTWKIVEKPEDLNKPKFVLYTGTETTEEKEIIRNIFNGNWKYVSEEISTKLREKAANNMYGEIIKVFMITASGAEGISLENVRYVHITEPYWHPVRTEQVIGRARRICSHQNLPLELRTIKVFLYLMVLSEAQKKSDDSIDLRNKDKSKIDNKTPVTTDEALYEIATIKQEVADKLLGSVKEASIDCALHASFGEKEPIHCFTFGSSDNSKFAYKPSLKDEDTDEIAAKNQTILTWKGQDITLAGTKYVLKNDTKEVYDYDSYQRGNPVKIGTLIKNADNTITLKGL